ncbi:type IV secretory system conjugative DNA transfer family protein [Epibacterium ulvae]|uniref:type IV secretory system conjugative DNA transfer family protein n=1 Tax=Epibacterium ulvae TaxID=1156985 RepID=UPI001BFC3C49|nr:type IV secretory system conjugative DNA transfer family protein [Epibacterium ulvae]MBT8154366.1 type IV secretory system conjugative DNA transfer family protein [Epibacterium ulvae]
MKHSPIYSPQCIAIVLLATLLCIWLPDAALADLVWHNGRWIDERSLRNANGFSLETIMSLSRIAVMGGATLLGFVIGWFFSPEAKELRRAILGLLAVLAGLYILMVDDAVSWSMAFLIGLCGFCWGIGYWLGRGLQGLMKPPSTFGSAKWANGDHLNEKNLFDGEGIFLGKFRVGETLWDVIYKGDRHLFTYAPTRGGKGVSQIIPNLLRYLGSVLAIDPKSENLQVTAKARIEMGQEVYAIDPWNIGAAKVGVIGGAILGHGSGGVVHSP